MALHAVLPDSLKAVVDFLTAHADLVPLHGGRVGTRLQSNLAAVRIGGLGGQQPWPWEASPQYAIEWWGPSTDIGPGTALTLCRTGEAALWELANRGITGGRITEFSMPLSQLWLPDETTDRPRFRTDVALTIHPA